MDLKSPYGGFRGGFKLGINGLLIKGALPQTPTGGLKNHVMNFLQTEEEFSVFSNFIKKS